MRQYKCFLDKQQCNNAKPFPVHVVTIEEIENYYYMNVLIWCT